MLVHCLESILVLWLYLVPSVMSGNAVRLHGWNAFILFEDYPVALCTVPKVGCTALRQWVLNLSPERLGRCKLELTRNNTHRLQDPACQSLAHFRNLTRFKKSGFTKFKYYCRQRHADPSEYLLGKDKCMAQTDQYRIERAARRNALASLFTATFVRHPVDRFVSWFVDKVLMAAADHNRRHVPRDFDLSLLSSAGFGVSAMIRSFRDMRHLFWDCDFALDEHYASQSCMCRHDVVKYSFVGRLESMRIDFPKLVGEMSRRYNGVPGSARELVHTLPSDMNVKGSSALTRYVQGNLTMDDMLALYDIYQHDFIAFNYTIVEWWRKHKHGEHA